MQNIRQNGSESSLIFIRTVIEPANNISSQPNSSAFFRLYPLMLKNIHDMYIMYQTVIYLNSKKSCFSTFYLNCTAMCFRG